jgi:hypothetical protein
MKATPLILAVALTTGSASALAEAGGNAYDDSTDSGRSALEKFLAPNPQTLRWVVADEARKAELDREGFPQYTD